MEAERWTPTGGTPQGAVISPLLANLYLHPLDILMASKGYRMVRYADDFVVLCRTADEAEGALAEVRAWVMDAGLTLHPDKTHVGDCREAGQGFDFLGYRFEAGRRWVRKKSLNAMKDKLRSKTGRTRGVSWMAFSDVACEHCCASRKSGQASGAVMLIMFAGEMLSSLGKGSLP